MDKKECNAKGGEFRDGRCLVPLKESKSKPTKLKVKVADDSKKSSVLWLILSLIIDCIGLLSYLFPGIGETMDIIWGPVSGVLVYLMYGSPLAALTQTFEEIIPFTDFIPTATLTWVIYFVKERM